jgi:MSHA biogenesis protein MshN
LIEKPAPSGSVSRVLTAEQRAENLYLDAVERIRQGQNSDAQGALKRALSEYPLHHASRQLLARSLLETGQVDSAKTMLRDGLTLAPQRLDFYMALAQASLVGNDLEAAIKTMESGLPVASDNAEFHALLANLLQRNSRHDEAIQHFVTSLRKQPDSANVLLGLGISLQEKKDKASAAEAYQRAIELGLSPSLMQFAQDRLRQLNR